MPAALFLRDGERFVPTELCRGPWDPDAQHGGPPAALPPSAIERFADGETMHVARLTVELLRPVPLTRLAVTMRWAGRGRRVQRVEAVLAAGDVEVAHASAVRIRRTALPVPARGPTPKPPPPPERGVPGEPPWAQSMARPAFHSDGVEHRFVGGSFAEPGPATDWIRLRVPVVAGEPTSPLARVAAAADFGNGISWVVSRLDGWRFLNPDLTIYLTRTPVGEWVCLDAVTSLGSEGVALAESQLWDERGPLGRALQSLLLERPGV